VGGECCGHPGRRIARGGILNVLNKENPFSAFIKILIIERNARQFNKW
jgi:hypothetical protein